MRKQQSSEKDRGPRVPNIVTKLESGDVLVRIDSGGRGIIKSYYTNEREGEPGKEALVLHRSIWNGKEEVKDDTQDTEKLSEINITGAQRRRDAIVFMKKGGMGKREQGAAIIEFVSKKFREYEDERKKTKDAKRKRELTKKIKALKKVKTNWEETQAQEESDEKERQHKGHASTR
jgi:hypothetical protein